ncbi:MAG: hypothetical protein LBQ14_05890 [Treponema sp.]|jgi:hypothetical protein|nr:hypothetical protein [Treponema sp.]
MGRKKAAAAVSRWIFALFLSGSLGMPLAGAELTVPRLELATRGHTEEGDFTLSSAAAVDLALLGGYKYGILLGFSFESDNLEKAIAYRNFTLAPPGFPAGQDDYNGQVADKVNNQAVLAFRIAKATARDLFNKPLELSYFIGINDYFCSGDEFVTRFGTGQVGTGFRGFFYFPEGIGGIISRQYNGIHGVRGTGLSLALTSWDFLLPMVYIYQDYAFAEGMQFSDTNHFSGDLRVLFNKDWLKLEGFTGLTLSRDQSPLIRGGFLALLSGEGGAELLVQLGIPGWKAGEGSNVDKFYFLIEPRIDFGLMALNVTFFYHPLRYLQIETPEERGKADINIKLLFGDALENKVEGGLESTLALKVDQGEDLSAFISPFISFVSDGLRWDAKLRVDPASYDKPHEMFEFFMGVRAAF